MVLDLENPKLLITRGNDRIVCNIWIVLHSAIIGVHDLGGGGTSPDTIWQS